ncbi:MAG: CvpA family protein [Planctomycetaceae bacterium]|nr:CvpA family protein [Planctomycetaceae bacterium]
MRVQEFLWAVDVMIWYDFVVLAVLIYTAWQGAQRGLVVQLAWIAALVLCFKFADKLAPSIEHTINVEQPLKHWIAMFVLYIGFFLACFTVARMLDSWLEKAKFKDFDRHLGGLFGFMKGVIICLVATFFAVTLSESLKATVLQSRSGYAACVILDNIEPLTPEYFHEYLVKYKEQLRPIHEQLGHETSLPDIWGGTGGPGGSSAPTGVSGQGNGFQLPDLFGGLAGSSTTSPAETPPPESAAPSLDAILRTLPQQLRDQFGNQIQQQWNSATPEQKQNLVNNLGRSFDYEMPSIVRDFVSTLSQPTSTPAGTPVDNTTRLLSQIGDIYQDRDTIVRRTQEHLAGIPVQVQQAVIADWYADLSLQSSDPDPQTNIQTRLDDRIIRQLDKAGISMNRLSYEVQQRLNQSMR